MGIMSTSDSRKGKGAESASERTCKDCGVAGLSRENITGLCAPCYQSLPTAAKASKTTVAIGILSQVARQLIDHRGLSVGAKLLELDPETTAALLDGDVRILPARRVAEDGEPVTVARQLTATHLGLPEEHPLAGVWLDPALLADLVRRHRDLQPLPGGYARLLAPWLRAMRIEACKDLAGEITKRANRAKQCADAMRYVPAMDAPLDPALAVNAFGHDPKFGHQPEHRVPLRIAVSLQAAGYGPTTIVRVAARAGRPISRSVVGRLLTRSKRRFAGAMAVRMGELASELKRPRGRRR